MSITVGIDLGTTNSAVAIHDGESPRLILNDVGSNLTPSAIWEDPSGKLVFGSVAYQKAGAASRFKRSMGSNTSFEVGTHSLSPEECSALVLRKLVVDAERSLGDEISSAVITVPANWKDAPRRATETAGRLAGLKVERLINEPTAAAMAYGLRADADGKTIAVYDLGGGTFDITLLRVRERVFDVLTSCGDEKLGGLDFDKRILELVMSRIEQQSGYRLPPEGGREPKMEQRIRELELRCEAAKHELSSADETVVSFGFLDLHESEPLGVEEPLSRSDFESLIETDVAKSMDYMTTALRASKLAPTDVDEVVLVGGSTRIPLVRERVAEYFGREPLTGAVNPDEAIALGAAIQAQIISQPSVTGDSPVALDIVNNSLGVSVVEEINQQFVSGVFSKIIEKGTKVPTAPYTESYRTVRDGQTAIEINCYEGEAPVVSQNTFLPPAISVDGIPPRPAGEMRIDITFTKSVDDILSVTWSVPDAGMEGTHEIAMRRGLDSESSVRGRASDLEGMFWRGRGRADGGRRRTPSTDPLDRWRESPLAPRFKSLVERAAHVASENPTAARGELGETLAQLKQAIVDGDEVSAEALDLRLTDLLFDME